MDTTDARYSTVELVELQINCVKCGGALEVQCAEWRSEHPLVAHNFACPYCTRPNGMEGTGAVTVGHQTVCEQVASESLTTANHGEGKRTIAGLRRSRRDVRHLREKLLKRFGRGKQCAVRLRVELVLLWMFGDRPNVFGKRVQRMCGVVVHFHTDTCTT